ncbi:MAG: NfeD family protein [Hyphomonadaceae bacterium]|nr:NfeD family protein [Hyphomonadaceae bacterium]MBC6412289.1 NfeD family protein [Hyphomonadaceae bacterium]
MADDNFLVAMLTSIDGTKWVILGVVLLILEVITGTTYILWPAFSALFVGIVVFFLPLSLQMQFLLFFILSTSLMWIGHKYIRPRMKGGEPSDLNDRARSMVGRRVRAVADFDAGQGRVRVGDTQWRAAMRDGDAKAGDELRVVSVDGTTLMVVPHGVSRNFPILSGFTGRH